MLGLAFQSRTEFTASEFEFFQALAQQATLAIQLTQLAEEAKQVEIAREQKKAAQERAAELAMATRHCDEVWKDYLKLEILMYYGFILVRSDDGHRCIRRSSL
jgi:hypothetical protein